MKNVTQLLAEIKILNHENQELRKQLLATEESLRAIKKGNIDALVVSHQQSLKIYTEQTADKTYRILIEKMHEGAVTLNKDGMILYCNTWFANMVGFPLQKVMGTKFRKFVGDASKDVYWDLLRKGWQGYTQDELELVTAGDSTIPVLVSVKSLSLEENVVLSMIVTDLTLQKNRAAFKNALTEKIIHVIDEMHRLGDLPKVNNSHYLSEQLNYDYTYLANIFSEVKGITIQKFIIVHKIEKVKELLVNTELNLTEISYRLQYSNVPHLSNQFKKITGFTPSHYKQMMQNEKQKKINL